MKTGILSCSFYYCCCVKLRLPHLDSWLESFGQILISSIGKTKRIICLKNWQQQKNPKKMIFATKQKNFYCLIFFYVSSFCFQKILKKNSEGKILPTNMPTAPFGLKTLLTAKKIQKKKSKKKFAWFFFFLSEMLLLHQKYQGYY